LTNKQFVESLFPEFDGDVHSYYTCAANCKITADNIFYEKSKKKKKFQHSWLYSPDYAFDATTDVWWLIHKENVGMYCLLCRKHKGKSKTNKENTIWNTKPCVKFLGDAIRDHLKSGKHKKAIETEKLQRVSSFEQEIQHKDNVQYEVVRNVFSAMYWLAKEEMPCKKLITMLELVQRMGLTDMQYFNHRSYPSIREMFLYLGSAVKDAVLKQVISANCQSYGILLDEVSDVAVQEQLVTFIKFVNSEGIPETKFLSCEALTSVDGANAVEIKKALLEILKQSKLDQSKMTCIVSDGASVMMGKNNGLAALLKRDNKALISIHCICHKLALACADTGKDKQLKGIDEAEKFLLQLWIFFEYSPKRTAIFIKVQEEIQNIHLSKKSRKRVGKKVRKACKTRWLSIDNSVQSAVENYEPIIHTLKDLKANATALGLYKKMKKAKFLGILYILKQILPVLSHLSRTFQTGALNYSHVVPAIDSTKQQISTVVDPLPKLKEDLNSIFGHMEMVINEGDQQYLSRLFCNYKAALISNIDSRFQDCMGLLTCFSVFDPNLVPKPQDVDFKEYGQEAVEKMGRHFYQESDTLEDDVNHLLAEWTHFKFVLHSWKDIPGVIKDSNQYTPLEQALIYMLKQKKNYQHFYPKIVMLAELVLSAPITNAWPERGASCVKRIKTRLRSRLKNDMLNSLMHISINGPKLGSNEAESLIDQATHNWLAAKQRRKLPGSHYRCPQPEAAATTPVSIAASATPVSEADIERDFCLTMAPDNQVDSEDSEPESDSEYGSESDVELDSEPESE